MAYSLDDEWENGPMIRRAGVAAFGLYCVCGLWIARHLSDGFVPADVAASNGSREWAAKLVDAGLWEVVDAGFYDPWYLLRNPSAEKVRARRAAEAERKAKWRARQQKTRDKTRDTRRTTGGTDGDVPRSHSPPKGEGRPREAVAPPPIVAEVRARLSAKKRAPTPKRTFAELRAATPDVPQDQPTNQDRTEGDRDGQV